MTGAAPLFCDPDRTVAMAMRAAIGGGTVFDDLAALREHLLRTTEDDTLVLGPSVHDDEAFALAEYMQLNRPVLGVVLVRKEVTTPLLQQALRAGVFEVVHERDARSLGSAVQRSAHLAAAKRARAATARPMEVVEAVPAARRAVVVTVFSAKGGCGKTTLATNVASVLADRGRAKVCIVDLDLTFGDVAITMRLVPTHTIADVAAAQGGLDPTAVRGLLTQHSSGLFAAVAPTEPSAAESISPAVVAALLAQLQADFDYLVIDTPPAFNDQVLAALDISDVIALVVTPDVPALKNLKIAMETFGELGYPSERLRLVLNRADAKVGISVTEVERTARMRCAAQLPSSRDVPLSINRGVPIVLDDPRHAVSQAIRHFATTQLPRVEGALDRIARTGGQQTIDVREQRRSLIMRRQRG